MMEEQHKANPYGVRIRQLQAQNLRLTNTILAMISNIEQMTIGVGLPELFVVEHEGKQYAVQPDKALSFYRAIEDKWKKDCNDLVRYRQEEVRKAQTWALPFFDDYQQMRKDVAMSNHLIDTFNYQNEVGQLLLYWKYKQQLKAREQRTEEQRRKEIERYQRGDYAEQQI